MSRAAALQRYGLAGPGLEPGLDAIAAAAARVCDAPLAFVSLADDDQQWFKGRYGANLASLRPVSAFEERVLRAGTTIVRGASASIALA